ncbi:MAG: rod shape-determining protein MreD [Spirochaetales bacterium]|nr:rod shape-determining protein MreD [Spirochaetales bacterium]
MRYILYGLTILLFSFGQSLAFYIEPYMGGAFPHVSLLLVLYVALLRGPTLGLFVAFLAGVVFDVSSVLPLGFHIAVFSTLAYLLGTFRSLVLIDRLIGPLLLALIGYFAYSVLALSLGGIFGLMNFASIARTTTLLEILFTVLVSPIIYTLSLSFENLLRKRPGGRYK